MSVVVDPTDATRMLRMPAESLASKIAIDTSALAPSGSPEPLGWLVFVSLLVLGLVCVPCLAWLIRRQLPATHRVARNRDLEPVRFGTSAKSLRSPRHAVLQHRTLMTTVLVCVLALLVLPAVSALRSLGLSALQVAIGLVLPTFVVALHARQRDSAR